MDIELNTLSVMYELTDYLINHGYTHYELQGTTDFINEQTELFRDKLKETIINTFNEGVQ